MKDDYLTRDGGGEFYKVGVSPRVARIEHVDYVYLFEIQRGWGVDSVHFEIQIGGEDNFFLSRGTPEGLKKGDSARGFEVVDFASKWGGATA